VIFISGRRVLSQRSKMEKGVVGIAKVGEVRGKEGKERRIINN
jgi:hypothetical protein